MMALKKVQVIKGLEDVTVCETEACTFEVTLSHVYIRGVWTRNGVQLKSKPTCRIAAQGKRHTLTLTRTSLSDMGRISFQAEGVETSATLTVTARDIEIVRHLADVSVNERETLTLVCEVNLENVDGKWFKNNIRMKDGDNIKIRHECMTHSLTFKAIKPEDAGEITFTAERASTSAVLRVKELPVQFVKPLRVKAALYKHRALLECQVSRANAKVTWYKRGREVLSIGRYRVVSEGVYQQLIIHDVGSSDEDVFICDAGDSKTSCQLLVEEQAISIVRGLSSAEVVEPKHACFSVETNLKAERAPRWSLNGKPLSSSPGVRIESEGTSHRLTLTNTNSSMCGTVQFSSGKSRSMAQLTVTERPLVVTQPISDVVVKENGSVTLSCMFCPSPRVVRWFKGRTPLLTSSKYRIGQEKNRAEITITEAKDTDSGEYRCLAGGAESKGRVNVEVERLNVIRHLDQVEVEEEGTALFCCELNHEVVSVQWLVNDKIIHTSHLNEIQNAGKVHKLCLKKLTPQVSRVTFKTAGLTETAILRVKERPAVFLRSLEDVSAEEHGKACLRCVVSKQVVTPIWKKDGIVLTASEKHEILHLGNSLSLIINKLRKDDTGEYTCDVETSRTKAMVVVCDPHVSIVRRFRTTMVLEGESCHFECVLSHAVFTEAFWTLNGQLIVSGDRIQVANEGCRYLLQIHEVMVSDAGEVTFTIKDLSCRTMLFVKEKPVVVFRDMLSAKAAPGEDVELSCEITKPEVTVKWLKNGRLIRAGHKYEISQKDHLVKLIIRNSTLSDSGDYYCEADGIATRARLEVRDFQHTFAKELKDLQAEEKSTAVLECETQVPAPRVSWKKGMTTVTAGQKYLMMKKGVTLSLTIFNVKETDSDLYTCDVGTMQSTAFLTVCGEKINILDELEDTKCLEGDTVTFKCRICPNDFDEVKWYLDETLLYTNDLNEIKMIPDGYHTLTMRQLACKDTGTISFVARDKRSYAYLLVRERCPTIIKPLEDTEAIEGARLVLHCRTSKPCHILWYKNGCLVWSSSNCQMSRSGNEAELTIHEVKDTDAGVYSCDAGSVSTSATVTVKAVPAEFTKQLQSQEAKEGGSVTLSCELSMPGAQYEWRRGTHTIRSGKKYLMKQKNNSISLTIHNVHLEDSGTYTCICRNQRTTATVTVHALSVTFIKQLKDQESHEGRTVTLRCELSRSGAPVRWLRDQEALSPGWKYHIRQIVTIQELVISNSGPDDSGIYSCICADQRTQATITIKALPITFTQKLKSQMAEEGNSVTLRCELSKFGLPVEWRKGNELLSSGRKYEMRQRGSVLEMKILHLRCEDSDVYSCSYSTASTSASVTVSRQSISFKEKLKNQLVEEGQVMTLHCELSKPGVAVEWWKGEMLLQPGQKYQMRERDASHKLVIADTVPADSGLYTCVCGDQKTKATVKIIGVATTFKQNLKNQEAPEGGSVVFQCELSKTGAPVEWWKGEEYLTPGGKYKMRQEGKVTVMEITDVLPDDAGIYSCMTGNRRSSAQLKVKALPMTFKRGLLDQVCKEGDSAVFTGELSRPGVAVEWRKGRVLLKPGAKYKITLEGQLAKLVINDVEEGDSGIYTCKTSDTQSTCELTVQAHPTFFKKHLTNQEAQEGNSISLHCELSKPGAHLEWWRAGNILRTGEKYQLRQRGLAAELLIRTAEPEDTGVYRCVCGEQSTEASITVHAHPITFKQDLKNQDAMEGSSVTLCCELSKAGAQVQWWKGEVLLRYGEKYQIRQTGTKVQLVIRRAVPEDSGDYTCACQTQRSKATVRIKALPTIFKQNLRNQEAVEGNNITLHCELSKPGASVSWWKGQVLLTLGEKYHMKTDGRICEMTIRKVETEDSGSYSCTVEDQKTTSEIKVQALPVTFKQELQNEVTIVGGTALFCCELSMFGAAVHWRKGRVILKAGDKYKMKHEGNTAKLIIDSVEEEDAGTYSCKTRDSESKAQLLVRVPPTIFKVKLKDQDVEEEKTVSLYCELSRTDIPVQWKKGHKLLTSDSKYEIRHQGAAVELIIKNAVVEDSGIYSCICGSQKTRASINVSATPFTFKQTLKNQEAPEGGAVVLHCELSKPWAHVQWLKEEEELKNGAKYKIKQEGLLAELHIMNVLPMDVGKYTCVAGDQITTAEVNVRAAASAFFEKGLQNQEAMEGSSVVFSCLLSSSNSPATWKKDSKQIKQGGRLVFRVKGATQELEIRRLELADAGVYTCTSRGKKTSAVLRVLAQVRIVRELQDVTVTAGEDALFVCELSHEGISNGTWWLGSSVLQENEMNQMSCQGREHHLVLTMTTPEESGLVAFVVGGERTEALLQVNCKPKVLIEEKLMDMVVLEGDTATLSCVTSDTCTPVTWKQNNITLMPGDKYELHKEGKRNLLLIHRVGQEDAGIYACDSGDMQSLATLTIKERPLFFCEELQNQQAEESETASFSCKLSQPGITVQWKKGNALLKHGQKYEMTQDGCKLQLQIHNLMIQDCGTYTCCADSIENKASLIVKEQPLFFCMELQSVEIEEGETAFLSCELSKAGVGVAWKKGTMLLRPGSKYEMKQDGCNLELQIRDMKHQDSGIYKCCAIGTLETKANILVKDHPLYFREHLKSQQVEEGDAVFLSCELSKPGISVQWKKGTVPLKPGDKFQMKWDGCKQQLMIHDLRGQDSGVYKCYAGSLVTTASIKVKEQPVFFCKELKNQKAEEGEVVWMWCELSKPGVAVQWKKEAKLLRPGDKYEIKKDGCKQQLCIHHVKYEDSGTYKCCVGSLFTAACLEVKGHVLFFSEELRSLEEEEGETVSLGCELSKPGITVQWKKGTALLKAGHKYEMKQDGCKLQLKIRNLESQDSGSYECCAGCLVTTASITVKEASTKPMNALMAPCSGDNNLLEGHSVTDGQSNVLRQERPNAGPPSSLDTVLKKLRHDHPDHDMKSLGKQDAKKTTVMRENEEENEKLKMKLDVNEPTHSEEEVKISFPVDHVPAGQSNRGAELAAVNITESSASQTNKKVIEQVKMNTPCKDTAEHQNKSIPMGEPSCKIKFTQPNVHVQEQHSVLESEKQVVVVEPSMKTTSSMEFLVTLESEQMDLIEKKAEGKDITRESMLKQQLDPEKPEVHNKIHSETRSVPPSGGFEEKLPKHVEKKVMVDTIVDQKFCKQHLSVIEVPDMSISTKSFQQIAVQAGQILPYTGIASQTTGKQAIQMERIPETQNWIKKQSKIKDPGIDIEENMSETVIDQKCMKEHIISRKRSNVCLKPHQDVEQAMQNVQHKEYSQEENRNQVIELVPVMLTTQPQAGAAEESKVEDAGMEIKVNKTTNQVSQTDDATESPKHTNLAEVDTPFIEKGSKEEPGMVEADVKIQATFKGYEALKNMQPFFKEVFKNQSVELGATVVLVCATEAKVSIVRWLKDGVDLKSTKRHKINHTEDGRCTLVIPNVISKDAGIYTCEVSNEFGSISYNGNVLVRETLQKPATEPNLDMEAVSTSDTEGHAQRLVCDWPAATSYKIQEKRKGNGATIRSSSYKWPYTSGNMASLSDSDGDGDTAQTFDVYVAIVDCQSIEGDKEPFILKEGQFVEVLDSVHPVKWLIRTKPTKTTPSRQGWLCPAYLEKKTKELLSMAHGPETKDMSEEGEKTDTDGSRGAVSEVIRSLLHSEDQFVREMNCFVGHLQSAESSRNSSQEERMLHNVKTMANFHESCFLPKLRECTQADDIAQCFVNHADGFTTHAQYISEQLQSEACISDINMQHVCKLDSEDVSTSTSLQRPLEMIQTYKTLLKELIRTEARSGQTCRLLEDAFSMVCCLPWRAENLHHLSLIENYPTPLRGLGEPIRQGAFRVWEEAPGTKMSLRGHHRRVFLFKDCVVFCKPKKDVNTRREIYVFKSKMELCDVQLKDQVEGDDRSWGLWHEHRGTVRKVTLQGPAPAGRLSWLRDLRDLQEQFSKIPLWVQEQETKRPSQSHPHSPILKPGLMFWGGISSTSSSSLTNHLRISCVKNSDPQEVKEPQAHDTKGEMRVQPEKTPATSETEEEDDHPPKYTDRTVVQVAGEDLCARSGQSAGLSAGPSEQRPPEVTWCKAVGGADCGPYTCAVTNCSGLASYQAQLRVDADRMTFSEPVGFEKMEAKREMKVGVIKRRKLHSVYDVHEEIGRGTFGVVKRISRLGGGEVLAAKFIPLRRDTRTTACQERDLLSRLTHHRLAFLLDVFSTRHTLVLVTDICCSQGLLDRLLLKASVAERQVQGYIQQILDGVEYIHSMNILHLDIKTDNILMVSLETEDLKICDFGFCQEIDPSRHQYSVSGTPEFVAPEIARQEPVTTATDIWSIGVVAYLCLTGHCPFLGENDSATLARVMEGVLHWGAPELSSRSQQAQDFLRKVLQPDPGMRPSALECLNHRWIEGQYNDDGLDNINTKNLKSFISRRKWQRSLTCLGSVLTLRPIPELLNASPGEVSITTSRNPQEMSSSSPSGASSSEDDETDSWDFFQPTSHEEDEGREGEGGEEYEPRAYLPLQTSALQRDESDVGVGQERPQRGMLVISGNKPSTESPEPISRELPEGSESVACGRSIPRGSLIKSTFYSRSQQLSPPSARHLAFQHQLQRRNQERGRKLPRLGLAGRVKEPLIEYVEDLPDAEATQRRGRDDVPKSRSLLFSSLGSRTNPVCLALSNQRRSRSLDETTRCSSASVKHWKMGKEGGYEEEVIDKEEDDTPDLIKNRSQWKSVAPSKLSPVAVAKVTSHLHRTVMEQHPVSSGVVDNNQSKPGEEESTALEGEGIAASPLSLSEDPAFGSHSEASSLDGFREGLVSHTHHRQYSNSEDCLLTLSSGQASECSLFQDSEDEDMDMKAFRLPPPTHRVHSSETLRALAGKKNTALSQSSSVLRARPASVTPHCTHTLQRHSSAPALQAEATGGQHRAGLLKVLRMQSWRKHSSSEMEHSAEESTCPLQAPLLTLRKKIRASASGITRLFTRQRSTENKKEKTGPIVRNTVPLRKTSVTSDHWPLDASSGSLQRKPKIFSIKLPSFRKSKDTLVRPGRPEVVLLAGGGALVFWKPVASIGHATYCIQCTVNGLDWTTLSNDVSDSCYIATALTRGLAYVFRVACVTKKSSGPFSEPSAPAVMAVPYEDSNIPLILTQSVGSKVRVPGGLDSERILKFLSEINRGRSSVVVQCEDSRSPERLAAKITPYRPEQRQLVLREYQVLRRLHHPHLVCLHAAILSPTCLVLVEELCSGPELLHHLAHRDMYAEVDVTGLLRQVLAGVDYLHARCIVHLGLSPDNMLVTEHSVVKIVDMSSAQSFIPGQMISTEHVQEMTQSRVCIVLPKAPEILEGHGIGPSTDIWALGLLTFIMLSADSPFHAELSWERDRNIRKGKIQLGRCYPGLSEGAISFLKRTLDTKSWGRPSAAECLRDPWVLPERDPSKHSSSPVSFSTQKLQAFLRDREARRIRLRTRVALPLA